jgi:hypothetical protein
MAPFRGCRDTGRVRRRDAAHEARVVGHRDQLGQLRLATPTLLPYDVTKAGIANMAAALAQLLAPRVAVTGGKPIL